MDQISHRELQVPRHRLWSIRIVAVGLPVLLVMAAWGDLNLWPATGWRLFSGLRHGTQPTWLVEVETSSGEVLAYDPSGAADARRSWRHQLDLALTDPERQRTLCLEWRQDAAAEVPDVANLVVRRATIDVPTHDGPSRILSSRVVARC